MELQVGGYLIESDNLQFIVKERRIKQDGEKKGEIYYTSEAYCVNFKDTLKFISNDILRNNDDVQVILNKLEHLAEVVEGLERKPVIYIKQDLGVIDNE